MLAFCLLYFPYIFKKDISSILLHNVIKLIWFEEAKWRLKKRHRSCFQFWDLSLFAVKIAIILSLSFMLKQKIICKSWGDNGFFPENALCIATSRVPLLHFVHVPITYRLFIIITHVHKMQDQTSVTESFTPTCTRVCVHVPIL